MTDLAEIVISVDTRQLKAANDELGALGRKGKETEEKISQSNEKTGNSFTALKGKIGLVTGALAALGAGALMTSVIRTTAEFTASLANLSAITGATGEDLEYLSEQAKDIGATTTLSASEAVTAFKLIASAKPDLLESGEALNAVTRAAVTLSEAAGIELTEAANTLGTSLNQFGAGAEEAARFINVLAAGAKFGASEIAQTSEALKNVGAAANSAGLSFEEANVGIQLLAAGGIKGAEAGTGLRNVLLKLEESTDQRLRPSVVGLATSLENLAAKNMDVTQASEMFGREAAIAALTLIEQADNAADLEIALTGTATAYEQAGTNVNNLAGDQAALNSVMEAFRIELGTRLEPVMRAAVQSLSSVIGFLTDNMDLLIVAITGIGAAMLVSFGPAIIAGITAVATAIWGANTASMAFMASPAAIAAAVAMAAVLMVRNWDDVKHAALSAALLIEIGWNNLKLFFQQKFADAIDSINGMFTDLSNNAVATWAAIKAATLDPLSAIETYNRVFDETIASLNEGKKANNGFSDAVDDTRRNIVRLETELVDLIRDHNDQTDAADAGAEALSHFENITDETIPTVKELGRTMGRTAEETDKLTKATSEVMANLLHERDQIGLTGLELEIYNNLKKAGVDASSELGQEIVKLTTQVYNEQVAYDATTDAAKKAAEEKEKAYQRMSSNVKGFFVDLLNNGRDAFDNLAKSFKDFIFNMVAEWATQKLMSLWSNFAQNGASAFSSLGSMWNSLLSSFSSGLSGLWNGIKSLFGGVSNFVSSAGSAITNIASGAASAITGAVSAVASGVGSAISTAVSTAGAAVSGVAGAVTSGLTAVGSTIAGVASGAVSAVTGAVSSITGAATGAVSAVTGAVTGTASSVTGAVTGGASVGGALSFLGPAALFAGIAFSMFGGDKIDYPTFAELPVDQQLDLLALNYERELQSSMGSADTEGALAFDPIQQADFANALVDAYGSDAKQTLIDLGLADMVDGSFREGLPYVPHDGFVAELHAGERVLTAEQTMAADRMSMDMGELKQTMEEIMVAVARNTQRLYRINDRWDKDGLPPTRS